MTSWLDPLRAALDAAPATVSFFFRDDDAGWNDPALFALLDVFSRPLIPIDVAVIPAELRDDLAAELVARSQRAPVSLHQHGYAHRNHEAEGRKCEFGASRSFEAQRSDVFMGRQRLREALGDAFDPIFTPPWNRCSSTLADALVEAGIRTLSRDRTAPRLHRKDLAELPITIDWFAHRKGVALSRAEVGSHVAEATRDPGPVGIMLHHAVMDTEDLRGVSELLSLLRTHERARCVRMRDVSL